MTSKWSKRLIWMLALVLLTWVPAQLVRGPETQNLAGGRDEAISQASPGVAAVIAGSLAVLGGITIGMVRIRRPWRN